MNSNNDKRFEAISFSDSKATSIFHAERHLSEDSGKRVTRKTSSEDDLQETIHEGCGWPW